VWSLLRFVVVLNTYSGADNGSRCSCVQRCSKWEQCHDSTVFSHDTYLVCQLSIFLSARVFLLSVVVAARLCSFAGQFWYRWPDPGCSIVATFFQLFERAILLQRESQSIIAFIALSILLSDERTIRPSPPIAMFVSSYSAPLHPTTFIGSSAPPARHMIFLALSAADANSEFPHLDPSLIHPYGAPAQTPISNGDYDFHAQMPPYAPQSPTPSTLSVQSSHRAPKRSQSPYLSAYQTYPYPPPSSHSAHSHSNSAGARRPSLMSRNSFDNGSQDGSLGESDDTNRGRCPNPDCGKVFKDLKAHMLTHMTERPEKCPIATCDYHVKGFARKYDKNRHTLTHYKGTMVCGFCPGSGSSAEKSFNRADVFKRHLTSVHAVEQTPPNSRKKLGAAGAGGQGGKLKGYAPDATGKCSTCGQMFRNAQEFYEHLDDCVLRIVQLEEPSERINEARLKEVENDPEVHETLRANGLPIETIKTSYGESDEDVEYPAADDDHDDDYTGKARKGKRASPTGKKGVGMTRSMGGVTLHTSKGRKKRKDYPASWGCPAQQMKLKKRVMCAFDGSRRLWKDDMMLSTDYEVRIPLGGGAEARGVGMEGVLVPGQGRWVTDLDVQTLRRAEAFHGATKEERGPEFGDGLDAEAGAEGELERLMSPTVVKEERVRSRSGSVATLG
jgi:hypothetical protein